MVASGGAGKGPEEEKSLAKRVFIELKHDDPLFKQLKELLLHGRRAEAINLIQQQDSRFKGDEAQELVKLVMNTLRDTSIDPL